jgi:hypothetical protein
VAAKFTLDDLVEALEPRLGCVRELDEPQGIDQLALLLLAREAPAKRARAELRKLQQDYVDWNDVRVTPIFELAGRFEAAGDKGAFRKAEELVDLMSTLYLRFNKMTVDVAPKEGATPDEAKRRQRLLAFLAEKSSLYAALMPLHGAKEEDVTPSPELTRVMSRLGLIEGRATDAAARETLLRKAKPGGRIAAQFVLHQLASRFCHAKAPACGECAWSAKCPSSEAAPEKESDAKSKGASKSKAKPKAAKAKAKGRS